MTDEFAVNVLKARETIKSPRIFAPNSRSKIYSPLTAILVVLLAKEHPLSSDEDRRRETF